jgi:hypothetical protein
MLLKVLPFSPKFLRGLIFAYCFQKSREGMVWFNRLYIQGETYFGICLEEVTEYANSPIVKFFIIRFFFRHVVET